MVMPTTGHFLGGEKVAKEPHKGESPLVYLPLCPTLEIVASMVVLSST